MKAESTTTTTISREFFRVLTSSNRRRVSSSVCIYLSLWWLHSTLEIYNCVQIGYFNLCLHFICDICCLFMIRRFVHEMHRVLICAFWLCVHLCGWGHDKVNESEVDDSGSDGRHLGWIFSLTSLWDGQWGGEIMCTVGLSAMFTGSSGMGSCFSPCDDAASWMKMDVHFLIHRFADQKS